MNSPHRKTRQLKGIDRVSLNLNAGGASHINTAAAWLVHLGLPLPESTEGSVSGQAGPPMPLLFSAPWPDWCCGVNETLGCTYGSTHMRSG